MHNLSYEDALLPVMNAEGPKRIAFPSVYRSGYLATIFRQIGRRPTTAAATFFLLYWFLPFVANLIPAGCVAPADKLTCISSRLLAYLTDHIHLAFSLLSTTVVYLAYSFVCAIHVNISHLALARKASSSRIELIFHYETAVSHQYRWPATIGSALVAGATFILFWDRIFSFEYLNWWGNIQNGASGLVYVLIASILAFLAAQYLVLLVGISLFIVKFSARNMQIRPFGEDGMSGLSAGGIILVQIWRQTAVLAVCLYLVFSSNYLDIAGHWAVWLFAFLGIAALPFAALVPFVFLVKEARKQKRRIRSLALRRLYGKKGVELDSADLLRFVEASDALEKINVLPIRGWRFIAISIFNAAQLYVSADTILQGFAN